VSEEGVEPSRSREQPGLSQPCLPFHHSDATFTVSHECLTTAPPPTGQITPTGKIKMLGAKVRTAPGR
jgi:hypothetical protein